MADPGHHPASEPSTHDWTRLESAYEKVRGDEPPELVDLAILNRAHREVAPTKPRRARAGIWVAGISTACLVMLAIGLTLRQQEELAPGVEPQTATTSEPESATTISAQSDRGEADADTAAFSKRTAAPPAALSRKAEEASRPEALRMEDSTLRFPEEWLELIRDLEARGLTDEAIRELDGMLAAYPEFPLPEDLSHLRQQSAED